MNQAEKKNVNVGNRGYQSIIKDKKVSDTALLNKTSVNYYHFPVNFIGVGPGSRPSYWED